MKTDIATTVKNFYIEQPFNYYESISDAVDHIKKDPVRSYPDLRQLLQSGDAPSLIEFGCGTGWFSNAAAYHYGKKVTSVDLTPAAIQRAKEVSVALGTDKKITFVNTDLFDYESSETTNLVVSIGVLHHTRNCKEAFTHIQKFVNPGGSLFVGLYHLYGRKVFLEMFKEINDKEGEEKAFERFKTFHTSYRNETFLRSRFRDQVLHPHETQHTLQEVTEWLDECGFTLESTSINKFGKITSLTELFELEKTYEQISYQRNYKENLFFPGFFTILARKR